MEMSNCLRCKKLFPRISDPICDDCKKKEEELYLTVRDFLHENREATVMQISEATGASHKRITQWLREGRLELALSNNELKCRQCNADITSGQYCEKCVLEMNLAIDDMFGTVGGKKPIDSQGVGKGSAMHTRNRRE